MLTFKFIEWLGSFCPAFSLGMKKLGDKDPNFDDPV